MGFMLNVANAIRTLLINNTVLDLTEETCSIDLDQAILSLIENNKSRACLITFGGGIKESREAMTRTTGGTFAQKGIIFKWRFNGVYMLHYVGDSMQIEVDVLEVIDQLAELMVGNQRLGDLVPFADMLQVGMPDGADINDMTFYLIPFSIEVWDKR